MVDHFLGQMVGMVDHFLGQMVGMADHFLGQMVEISEKNINYRRITIVQTSLPYIFPFPISPSSIPQIFDTELSLMIS